jgi:hypothetical protein
MLVTNEAQRKQAEARQAAALAQASEYTGLSDHEKRVKFDNLVAEGRLISPVHVPEKVDLSTLALKLLVTGLDNTLRHGAVLSRFDADRGILPRSKPFPSPPRAPLHPLAARLSAVAARHARMTRGARGE